MLDENCFEKLRELNLLKDDGVIVEEYGSRDKLDDNIAGYTKIKERKYGTITISLYGEPDDSDIVENDK